MSCIDPIQCHILRYKAYNKDSASDLINKSKLGQNPENVNFRVNTDNSANANQLGIRNLDDLLQSPHINCRVRARSRNSCPGSDICLEYGSTGIC